MNFLSWVYRHYDSGYQRKNALFRIHRAIIKNRFTPSLLFGTRVDPSFLANGYFDLTTVLLTREVLKAMRGRRGLALQEIGSGRFAIPAGFISRRTGSQVQTVDYDPIAVEGAQHHIALNGFDVEARRSDVLDGTPERQNDVVWWNLPYYDQPDRILEKLFTMLPNRLAPDGVGLFGFNSHPLPIATVTSALAEFPALKLDRVITYGWNKHAIVAVRRIS